MASEPASRRQPVSERLPVRDPTEQVTLPREAAAALRVQRSLESQLHKARKSVRVLQAQRAVLVSVIIILAFALIVVIWD